MALACVLGSALLAGLYARGGAGWMLGFVAFVPWLLALDTNRTAAGAWLGAWAMSVAYTAAVFGWLGMAIGSYTDIGTVGAMALLLLAAPLFQPQFFAYALVRRWIGHRHGRLLRALAAAAAWVAIERLVPRLLDDTFGHGLHPSRLLRQAADLGGAAGLTLALLLANEAIAGALARRADGVRAVAVPLALAVLVPLLLAGYGFAAVAGLPDAAGKPLRVALVQSNIVDYERLRREKGAAAVVREVLDVHYAMSYDAVERQRADAVLWSETVYPTTFGHPKSEAGADLDRELLGIVDAAGVPFVFGTYDRDADGEYNAAAFVAPGSGLLGHYRKTRLFPLTERVPGWLDGPALRHWLPWAGTWRPGTGARVFPLRLRDGREIPVLPLICLDDMDTQLAVEGARLGAQAILTMSNDAWFADPALGADLHLAAAAFRSIETRLPQFRVTTNGHSALIDATGTVVARTNLGERVLLVGELPIQEPRPTLVVAWGDWLGLAAAGFLAVLAATSAWRRIALRERHGAPPPLPVPADLPADVAVLPPAARWAAGLLRGWARLGLLGMVVWLLFGDDAVRSQTLLQIRVFAALYLAPEAAAWCVLRAFAARAAIEPGRLVLTRGARRLELGLHEIAGVEAWRLPLPGPGIALRLASGRRWHYGLAVADPAAWSHALGAAGAPLAPQPTLSRAMHYAHARAAVRRGRMDRWTVKFILFPLALAIPAFRLHQHIAYGSAFGEYQAHGLAAYVTTFALWWAAWTIGVALCAAVLRAAIEAGTMITVLLRPVQAVAVRRQLERLGLLALYLGLPGWLLWRTLSG